MKKSFALLSLLSLFSSPVSPQSPGTKQRALALTHATVIDITGAPAEPDMTIVIRGDRIVGMGKSGKIRVPRDARIVDAAGKFLIPGLWDMNVFWYEKDYLPLFIANGVTGLRVVSGSPEHYEMRKEIEAAQLLGPRMVIASRWVQGPTYPERGSILVANEAEARQAVSNAQKYGADFIFIRDNLPGDAFYGLADEAKKRGIPFEGEVPVSVSVEEASNAGMKSIDEEPYSFVLEMIFAGCSSREADLLKSWQVLASEQPEALWEGPRYRAPLQLALETSNPQKVKALSALLKASHTWLCPTLTARRNTTFLDDPSVASDPQRLKYMSAGNRRWWSAERDGFSRSWGQEDRAVRKKVYQKELEIVGGMGQAGAEFLAGTGTVHPLSSVPGFSLHDELALFVQAGLTPLEALQTATLNPARFFGREQDFGSVAPGKIADLVLLDANPLEDIGNTRKIAAVVYRGKLYPRASLDAMLAKIEALASKKSIGDVLAATIREKGVEAAIRQYRELKATQPDSYDFEDKYELSDVGHDLLHAKKFKEAIQMFELNADAFPRWWWTYDSLGDAYMAAGEKDLAIKNFKKSLELDPANQHAAIKLKQLNSQ